MPPNSDLQTPLYAIREVAEGAGITPEALRIWERRYGRPKPVRLPSGHRRYTEAQLRWLRRVAEALSRGHRPGDVVPLSETGLDGLLAQQGEGARREPQQEPWVELVRGFEAPTLRALMLAAWDKNRPLAYLEEFLAPLMEAIGTGWADGWLDVRHEHFASEVVHDLLSGLRREYEPAQDPPRLLLTTLPLEIHGLGLMSADLLCAARGMATRVLGVNMPLREITAAVRETGVRVLGISVSLATGGVETDRALAALRRELPQAVRLVVGGAGARGVRRGPRGVEYVASLAEWDALLADLA